MLISPLGVRCHLFFLNWRFLPDKLSQHPWDWPLHQMCRVCRTMAVGTLPWQPIFVGFIGLIGFYPQNRFRMSYDRWRQTTRSASAVGLTSLAYACHASLLWESASRGYNCPLTSFWCWGCLVYLSAAGVPQQKISYCQPAKTGDCMRMDQPVTALHWHRRVTSSSY